MTQNIVGNKLLISRGDRESIKSQRALTIWMSGLSGSGKSTIANNLEVELNKLNFHTYILDGDNTRLGLNKGLGFSEEDRIENIRRVAEVCKLMNEAGLIVICSFISPFQKNRDLAKEIIGDDKFIEVFIDTDIEVCESRDPKGLYKKARAGEIKDFTGISQPFEIPLSAIQLKNNNPEDLISNVKKLAEIVERKCTVWPKINHGGKPTNNPDEKWAVFIGRYQPYHFGHIQLIRQKLNEGVPALIMIRDIEPDERNPFTTEQTVQMIKKYHNSKGDRVEVMIIKDIESVNFGRGVGYEINEFTPPSSLESISATKIRDAIKSGDDTWKNQVDESIWEDIIKYLNQ